MRTTRSIPLSACLLALLAAGGRMVLAQTYQPLVKRAMCVFQSDRVSGHVAFTQTSTNMKVQYSIEGLSPGEHKWHIHLYGDVSQDTSMSSTGGHFIGTPATPRTEIGMITPVQPTATTLIDSKIVADAQSRAFDEIEDQQLTFSGPNSIVGRSVVIHGDESGPGVRVAMCVIGVARESDTDLENGADSSPTRTTRSLGAVAMTARVGGLRTSSTSGTWTRGSGFTGNFADKYWGHFRVASVPAGIVTGLQTLENTGNAILPTGGTVTVYEEIDQYGQIGLRLRYTINWAGTAQPSVSGIHIHEGETCANAGGHYWDQDEVGAVDPWTTNWDTAVRKTDGNTYASLGTTSRVYAGLSLDDVIGRTIVVHENSDGANANARVACGVIQSAPGGALSMKWSLGSSTSDARYDFHIHSGATCGDAGGHHYNSELIADNAISTTVASGADPWWSAQSGFWGPISTGTMHEGSDVVATGYDLHSGAGYASDPESFRTVVVHDSSGRKVACSVLSPDSIDMGGSKIDGRITFTNTKPTKPVTTLGSFNLQAVGDVPDQTNPIRIDYFFSGLIPGPHKLHVHTFGNVASTAGNLVGGHYVGSTPDLISRPGISGAAGAEKKVAYLQDGIPVVADANGVAQGSFVDATKFLLGGGNNVLGRSIVLHSPVDGVKVAQGVIGLANPDTVGSVSTLLYDDSNNDASNINGEAALAKRMNFESSSEEIENLGEPLVKAAVCTFVREGGVQGVYPDGFDASTSNSNAPKDSTAKDNSGVGNIQGVVRFQEQPSEDSPSGAATTVEWELSGLAHGKAYSWHIHTLGDIGRTDALGVSGHFVGKGVNRASVLAKLKGFNSGDTENAYGAVRVSRPLSAVFEGVQTKYPQYQQTQYAPVGAVSVTQVSDGVTAGGQTSVSPTLRVDYDFTGLEPSDRTTTSNYAVVGGIHIHSGTNCDDAGGHFFDSNFVNFDPWTTNYGPTDATGGARGSFLIRSGHSVKQVAGKVIVLHDSSGARMACAVLSLSGTTHSPLKLDFSVSNLGQNIAAGGLHIHSGTSCDSEQTQGGHDYDSSKYSDPWGQNTVYTTDNMGRGTGSFIVFNTGRSLEQVLRKVVVLHDANGARKACGIISDSDGPNMLATSADYDPRTVTSNGRVENSCLTAGNRADLSAALSEIPATCLEAAMIGNSARLPGPSNQSHSQGIDISGKGYSSGTIRDTFLTLNGPNSIVGRSIVIHENSRRIGTCVIGRAYDADAHDSVSTPKVVPSERSEGATCVLQSTGASAPPTTLARVQSWPAAQTQSLRPKGEVVMSQTSVLNAGQFVDLENGVILDKNSKVWLAQTGNDDITLYYALQYTNAGTAETGKNYGIHVHTGTDCSSTATQGGHMWLPRSEKDPWAGAASPYTYVLSGQNSNAPAYGSFVIKGGAGYTLEDMKNRVIVIHIGPTRVACAKLAMETGLAVSYDLAEGALPSMKGGLHLSRSSSKSCDASNSASNSARSTNMFTSDSTVQGQWHDYWHAISYTADASGRARGVAAVPSTYSAYDAQAAVVVFYRGLDHTVESAASPLGPFACGEFAWEYGAGDGPAAFRGGTQANVGRNDGASAGQIGGYVTIENSRATGGKSRIRWHISGLGAKSKHKWHIHNYGDVTPNSQGSMTGGHFIGEDLSDNSEGEQKWLTEGGEVGYIGNGSPYPKGPASVISADSSGVSVGEVMDDYISLSGPNSVIGRSIIIHGMRLNSVGNWVAGRAAMCTIGRANPESASVGGKRNPASTSSTSGVSFTGISAYPGYDGPLKDTISGIVTVGQIDRETVVLGYELSGMGTGTGDIGRTGGIHIHAGTSCEKISDVGGHFWDGSITRDDPWIPVKYNPIDASMNTKGSVNVISGYSLAQNLGRTIVIHHNGTKVGCGVLGNSITSGGAAEVAAAASGGGNCPGTYAALIQPYPGYVPSDGSSPMASGIVTVGQVDRHTVSITYALSGLTVGEAGGLHIHEGMTCNTASDVLGHFWNKAVTAEDPWTSAQGAVYDTAIDGIASGLPTGVSAGAFAVESGYSLVNNAGRAVVVHNANGDRIGCGVLASKADDPAFASLAEAAQAFAVQKTNSAALIDTPLEVLALSLSLLGVIVASLLIGFCLGRTCERRSQGGMMTNDLKRRISSRKLNDDDVNIEMTETQHGSSDQGQQKRKSLTAGFDNPLETGAAPLPVGPPTPRTENTLPPGWIEQVSGTHGKIYFYNTNTGESVWERPSN